LQKFEATTISRQSSHEDGKTVSPTHRPPLPQETSLVIISVRDLVDLKVTVLPKVLC